MLFKQHNEATLISFTAVLALLHDASPEKGAMIGCVTFTQGNVRHALILEDNRRFSCKSFPQIAALLDIMLLDGAESPIPARIGLWELYEAARLVGGRVTKAPTKGISSEGTRS